MRSALRLMPLLVVTAVVGYKLGSSGESPVVTATAEAATPQTNACGCYRDSAGACYCGKKGGKCACPGECEPQGCEEKRAKEMDKEVAAEAKRAREAEKKQEDEQAERDRKAALPPPGDDDDGDDKPDSADKKPASDSASARTDDDDEDDDKGAKKKKSKAKGAKSKHGNNDKSDKNDKGGGLEG
ncbi:MAG TPA: hypothetical protein VGP07_07405 [Polyangia bacterium]|jgi:hypothetical protein